jgi:hypothetical protein
VNVTNYSVTPCNEKVAGQVETLNDLQVNKDGYLFQIDNTGDQN